MLAESAIEQWADEEKLRRLHDPEPLPVQWHAAGPPLSDYWENIRIDGVDKPLRIDGRVADIATVFSSQLHRRRLVIIGEAGSGKTILAIRLLLRLVEERKDSDPVPVFLSMAAWDPEEDFVTWASRMIELDFPAVHDSARVAGSFVPDGSFPSWTGWTRCRSNAAPARSSPSTGWVRIRCWS